MKKILFLIFLISNGLVFSQPDMTRLTEMQKIFFVAEASGLASSSYNPAAMSIRADNNGVVLGYDFDDVKVQGNSSVFLTMNNIGISYQDIYNINNVRLQNYSVNLSIGNEYFSIGTNNRYTMALYPSYELKLFSFDAGLILRPADFLSLGFLARNLSEVSFDSLNYIRNYTAGIGLTFFNQTFNIFADADFRDNTKIDDLSGTVGLVIAPLNLFEFRGGVVLNPDNILEIRDGSVQFVDIKYEAFLAASFLIKDTIRLTTAARFNDAGKRTRFAAVFAFPLSRSGY